jgi:membrane-associated phospholipid phosphatase
MNLKKIVIGSILVVLLLICSYYLLDARIALFINKVWRSHARLAIFSSDIPDFLFLVVCIITVIAWTGYLYLARKEIYNIHTQFFQVVALTIPLAFALKSVLKYSIGRINTRFWLHHPSFKEFHWFHGVGNYGGFPSGHMTVFMALCIAFWKFYPRYRCLYASFLSVLALALVVTDYHFISDVLAGVYLGFIVNYFTNLGITFFSDRWTGTRHKY